MTGYETWTNWFGSVGSVTNSGSADYIWINWADSTTYTPACTPQGGGGFGTVTPETPEERCCREERQRQEEVERQRREQARKEGEKRALELLLDNLEANQKEIFEKTGAIPVVARSGKRYSIVKGSGVNEVDEKGNKVKHLCFHPDNECCYNLPQEDKMLTQLLFLKFAEEDVRRIANFS